LIEDWEADVYSDTFSSCNALNVASLMRINHSALFSNRKNHIDGIENSWNQSATCVV
jgi:transposase